MPPPHLFFLLADDLGYAELNFERPAPSPEVITPHIDALARGGLRLKRHIAFKFCSPSRSALISGRNPVHVNVNNFPPTRYNRDDPVSGYAGVPVNMTGWGTLMQRAGYETLFAGKWDAGMATRAHTPRGRGFESALGYFNHENDYWTLEAGTPCPSNLTGHRWHAYTKPADFNATRSFLARDGYLAAGHDWIAARDVTLPDARALCAPAAACRGFTFRDLERTPPPSRVLRVAFKTREQFVADRGVLPRDLWKDAGPAPPTLLSPQPQCSGTPFPSNATGCAYADDLFADAVLRRVSGWREADRPLFVLWAFHAAHSPYQVPRDDFDALGTVQPPQRRIYHALVRRMDRHIGTLVAQLEARSMWAQSLLVFSSDNGGPITQAANVRRGGLIPASSDSLPARPCPLGSVPAIPRLPFAHPDAA